MNKLFLLVHEPTPRIQYAADEFLGRRVGVRCAIVTPADSLPEHACTIAYGDHFQSIPAIFQASSSSGNFSNGCYQSWRNADSFLSFDVLKATFFHLSREEEYTDFQADAHNRFSALQSALGKADELQTPWIDVWAIQFRAQLKLLFPRLEFNPPLYQNRATFDIDHPFLMKHKSTLQAARAIVGSLLKSVSPGPFARMQMWLGTKPDKYDVFDDLMPHHPILFMLMGSSGGIDKAPGGDSLAFQKLMHRIGNQFEIGLHPSGAAADDLTSETLYTEKKALEQLLGRQVIQSRQHYLKLNFPSTYRKLIDVGIREDYTMVYPEQPGFRAATSIPFHWYDLQNEEITELMIYPTTWMDATARFYQNLTPETAERQVDELLKVVGETGGSFVSLMHNNAYAGGPEWENWPSTLKSLLKKVSAKG